MKTPQKIWLAFLWLITMLSMLYPGFLGFATFLSWICLAMGDDRKLTLILFTMCIIMIFVHIWTVVFTGDIITNMIK